MRPAARLLSLAVLAAAYLQVAAARDNMTSSHVWLAAKADSRQGSRVDDLVEQHLADLRKGSDAPETEGMTVLLCGAFGEYCAACMPFRFFGVIDGNLAAHPPPCFRPAARSMAVAVLIRAFFGA